MRQIIVIAHDLRSTHNVGSLIRTAEGLGIHKIYFTGYTPYPTVKNDRRLPHITQKLSKQINKTALDAEQSVAWEHHEDIVELVRKLRNDNYTICGLEQTADSVKLPDWQPPQKVVIMLGREVEGLATDILKLCDAIIEIPMFGKKESFNVVQAAAMTLYHCKFAQNDTK